MKRHPVSGTYARALRDIAIERGKIDEIAEELESLEQALYGDKSLRVFFESPKIPRPEKKSVLEKTLSGKVSAEVLNLLKILVDRGRQGLLDQICATFAELYDSHMKRMHVTVDCAVPIADQQASQLKELLGSRLDRTITMETRVDDDLLGGMKVRFGDTVIDGSIRTQLNKVREAVASQRLGSDLFNED